MSEQANCLQAEMLAEMKKQTALLERMETNQSILIQALAEDQADQDPDARPLTYMDGTPCC
ncbi:hypothetical protein IQK56_07745 [Pseudomonas sp. MAFF 301449]|uniref:Uncharacterized protein n=1 Tax=Pseudomonas cyclaminis TaxID=2781239 RepID=A0ABR9SPK5_9PSED|nr:hypothetical protein [Pseudomonas cyclaminis]MBE8590831.1 hypothetical protein [Pseudomonas cyclaminis]MBE8598503.1 hypothetical protein [Pseudomonas cyclaminis]